MTGRRIVAGVGRTFISLGVLILLFVAYQLWGTGLAEARAQDDLRDEFQKRLATTTTSEPERPADDVDPPPSTTTTTFPTGPPPPPEGDAVAIIRIPKIGLEKAVIEGVSVKHLKKAPGHYPGTPMPGQPGNAAIAGHRTTYGAPFYRLDELAPGDEILVTTQQGRFTYEVSESTVVKPHQSEVLDPTDDNRLTLTTCHPRYSARRRLIVVGRLVDRPAPAPPPEVRPVDPVDPADEIDDEPGEDDPVVDDSDAETIDAGLSGDPAARGPALLWGLLAAAIWAGTWFLGRQWGKLPAYALGTPLFLIVLFVFFENFARLLPANV